VRISVQRRPPRTRAPAWVLEVITPRTNEASLTSAENLLGAVALPQPFALEIAADHHARRFLVRAATPAMMQHLHGQLGATYPQAELRPVGTELDPARAGEHEQAACCALELRAPPYLPIRTFSDADVDPLRSGQADPILSILGGLADLPDGWRALSQLVLQAAPDDWCRDYLRLAVQHPLLPERIQRPSDSSLPALSLLVVGLGVAAFGVQAYALHRAAEWFSLVGLALGTASALAMGIPLGRKLLSRPIYDMDLVREKVSRLAYRCELRLSLFAPAGVRPAEVRARLARFAAAYRHYNLAAGNGFRTRWLAGEAGFADPRPLSSRRRRPILTTRELAGLWHLPRGAADVPLVERTTARRWLPLPSVVAGGCRIGVSRHQGRTVAVELPDDVVRRHLLLVAKTRRGKSTLMLRLAHHAMRAQPRRAVLLVDPHRDLADSAAGLVPPERERDVVFVDLANAERPIGLNVLDVGLGWGRDQAVANALTIFQREFGDRYWGPRMEDVFRFALLSLFEANAARCAADPDNGRATQYTLLDIAPLLRVDGFRRAVLGDVRDPVIHRWWSTYYEPLDRRFQAEIQNPVLTKVHRFEGNTTARRVVGQPASTIQPARWLDEGSIVIVNTARGTLGESVSALLGGTLLNLVALAVMDQAHREAEQRHGISILVDEFHTLPGADYEGILAELGKYGANLVLATQSLSQLVNVGGDRGRDLRAMVFANLDGLFAFNCSAEDAHYLVPELGSAVDEQDLVELGEHQCYVRLSSAGERIPTFSVSLDPPAASDRALRHRLASASAERYGRLAAEVDETIRSSISRVALLTEPRQVPVTAPKARSEHRAGRARNKRPAKEAAVKTGSEGEVMAHA
jgi:hypothetical protein